MIYTCCLVTDGLSCISPAQLLFVAYCIIYTPLPLPHPHPQRPLPVFKSQLEDNECANISRKYADMVVGTVIRSHFFFGVSFEAALDPERPFSVLSIPDEVTRHSLLQWNRKREGGVSEFSSFRKS